MVGQVVYQTGGRITVQKKMSGGLPIYQAGLAPEGAFADLRTRRVCRILRRAGCTRVILPEGFARWDALKRYGLHPVDTVPFLRACAPELVLAVLKRDGILSSRCTAALRGLRADGDVERAAVLLGRRVHNLILDFPRGGEQLAAVLRREYGIAVLPAEKRGEVAVLFSDVPARENKVLRLYGTAPELCGLHFSTPELSMEEVEKFQLLALLWEQGKLQKLRLNIT